MKDKKQLIAADYLTNKIRSLETLNKTSIDRGEYNSVTLRQIKEHAKLIVAQAETLMSDLR